MGSGHYPWGNFSGSGLSTGPPPAQQNVYGGSPTSQMPMAPSQPQPSFTPFYPMFPRPQMFGGSSGGLGDGMYRPHADRCDGTNDGSEN